MVEVKISSQSDTLEVKFAHAKGADKCYSYILFDQFALMLDNFISTDGTGHYKFKSTVDDERRILELLDDLTRQNGDIKVVHDSVISKNI